jgi:hypothetical protein
MPTEYRFEDLDLREEPARGDGAVRTAFAGSDRNTCWSATCNHTNTCTDACCL